MAHRASAEAWTATNGNHLWQSHCADTWDFWSAVAESSGDTAFHATRKALMCSPGTKRVVRPKPTPP